MTGTLGEARSLPRSTHQVAVADGNNDDFHGSLPSPLHREDVLDRLAEGIAGLTNSDAWLRWLDVARRLPSYSFNNLLLLALQTNGTASQVAGYRAWQALGRQVRRSERALWIVAPMRRRKRSGEPDGEDDAGTLVVETIVAWKPVPVFDITQTDGPPLPTVPCRRLDGDAPSLIDGFVSLAADLGYSVTRASFANSEKNGETVPAEHRIVIRDDISDRQAIKTLVHELAHCVLHIEAGQLKPLQRDICELEAESVAYVCLADLGIDSSAYSFGYVATWTQGRDTVRLIRESGERILTAARFISAWVNPA